jgi:ATP-dependent Lon protease
MSESENMQVLPVLPLKNSVLFPYLLMPLAVGRPASVAAVDAALSTEEKEIIIVAQREASTDTPGLEDLYTVGTKAVIKKMARPSESLMELIVLGVERVSLLKLEQPAPYLKVRVQPFPLPDDTSPEVEGADLAGSAEPFRCAPPHAHLPGS